jgi:hypothetical protein
MTATSLIHIDGQHAPIACTLTPGAYETRTAELTAIAAEALLRREPIQGGERLTFTDTPQVEQALRAAIAAEASCCSFLTMRLRRTEAGLVLDLTGPGDATPIVAELFA